MKTKTLSVILIILLFAVPVSSIAQDGGDAIPEVILNDDDPQTEGTTAGGEPTSDGGDAANVINPSESSNGKVELEKEGEYVNIKRSGVLVERVPLLSNESCEEGLGQVGKVMFCSSGVTLQLMGRPTYHCPAQSSTLYGPCAVQGS